MKITNIHNLNPDTVQLVTQTVYKPDPKILRVTQLIGPPLVRHLTIKHWDELETDASEMLWSLFGTDIHAKLEKLHRPNVIKEVSMALPLHDDYVLKGTVDLVDLMNLIITDYKTSSVWKAVYGEFEDYEAQINLYHLMLTKLGFPLMKSGQNILFLKDWAVSKAKQDDNYPKTQEFVVHHKLWPLEKTKEYLKSRVEAHMVEKPPVCSPVERWESETIYAVMKQGRKSALSGGLKKNLAEAEAMAREAGGYVETRPGTCRRCLEYCQVREVCPFAKKLQIS